jgi:hypothetical protein
LVDSGLRCPRCEYNLTGLIDARCPECGAPFSWEAVRAAADNRPTIAFERVRGRRKLSAFIVTWATVLFAPWIFARQIAQRVGWRHGLAFAGICFAGTSLAYAFDMDWEVHVAWLSAAVACVLLQALWLSLLDPGLWRQPRETLWFWLLAGCYTSAVMPTEAAFGPPLLMISDLLEVVQGSWPGGWISVFPFRSLSAGSVVCGLQMTLWLWALLFCYRRRLKGVIRGRPATGAVVFGAAVSLVLLYAAVVQLVGMRVHELID